MSGIRRIIFIKDTLFTDRDYERFGISLLEKNNFLVEIWEITPVLHADILDHLDTSTRVKSNNFTVFSDMESVRAAIAALDTATIVHILFPFTWQSLPVFRALSKCGIPTSTTSLGAVPVPSVYATENAAENRLPRLITTGKSLFQYPLRRSYTTVRNRVLLKYYRFAGVRPLSLILAGGSKSVSPSLMQLPADKSTQIVWGHSFDYDNYLTIRSSLDVPGPKYGVFIDQNIPFHPEHLYCDIYPVSTPEEYFPAVRSFFTIVEKECSCPIIIAAHPTADYQEKPEFFDNRKVVYGKTAQMIRNAEFVVTHHSTALNYALFFKKPLIFITTNAMDRSIMRQDLDMIAGLLGKKPINVDTARSFDREGELAFDPDAYSRYINDYIKTAGSKDRPLWQIYADAVRHLKE
jgi:hypothetical protein